MSGGFDALAARLVGPLAEVRRAELRDGGDEADCIERPAAAVVLGAVAEPGDGVLGRLVNLFGPVAAATLLLDRPSTPQLVAAFRAAGESLDGRTARAAVERWVPRIDPRAIVASVVQAARVGARFVVPSDPIWPSAVDDLGDHAPFGLWVRGRAEAITPSEQAIALVGARAATGYGELVAGEVAGGLSARGFVIVSGGAYGIDGAAHRAVLRRKGTTVAFLAGGVDRFYPTGHERLLTDIAGTGAVVSEMPCGAAPTRWRFLQRNRLIAAATAATVVLEAGARSGSLNTAGHAAALGRPLGAVPGPVTSPSSTGCHRLLREFDAVCVTDVAQVAELVTGECEPTATAMTDPTPEETRVLDALSAQRPRTVDDIARRAGLPPGRVMGVLAGLELADRARRREDGWVARRAEQRGRNSRNAGRSDGSG
ncbi:DNA-processing protein DprA [Agromyces aerolatus]|uniref:DNA-processing protein DprA n=1 Tax=Agromyces sp. LY-1074 TaxID=3074080 RepID=UPI002862B52D|nr:MULTISPECIES: DNA-processing protein DprA [unclassified Agromyces]MDR5699938.1 DNA-processing protein DprA [Agromyces sp. LY-1074]MDR5706250.1 DNA-processing protein DprA [Agromyces sp. LY-1358]